MRRALLPSILALAVLALAFSSPSVRAVPVTMPFTSQLTNVVDGSVTAGEYAGTFTEPRTGIEVHWAQNGTEMAVGIVAPGTGWASVGFGPENAIMDGVNILIGYVSGATTIFEDEFGVGFEHREDTALGGTDDLLVKAGGESGGKTTLEFRFLLDTGDAYDVAMQPGRPYTIALAYQEAADDFVTLHTAASATDLEIERDPSQVPTKVATLTLGYDGEARAGVQVVLRAVLLGEAGAPLPGAPVDFYLNSSVGVGLLGTSQTSSDGVATLNYTFLSPGEFEFLTRFVGDAQYLPAWGNATVVAANAGEQGALITGDMAVRGLIFTALAGVLVAYVYTLLQILRVRRVGGRARNPAARA